MKRLVTTAGTVVSTALVTVLVVVLTTASGGVGPAEAAGENANGPSNAVLARRVAANQKRVVAVLKRNKTAREGVAANAEAISGVSTTQGVQGPQGPVGGIGPQGPAGIGAAGPPGPPGLSNVEVVETVVRTVAPGGAFLDGAPCPVGKTVIGGGYRQVRSTGIIFNPDSTEALIFSVSVKSPNAESWLVATSNETASNRFFVTTAICANVNS